MTTECETATEASKIIEGIPDTPENVMRSVVTNIEVVECEGLIEERQS